MASANSKTFLLIQLSSLLVSLCFYTLGTHAQAPTQPPVQPPSGSPAPRSFLLVQGFVYCKPCRYANDSTLQGATPSDGAVVRLTCRNTPREPVVQEAETNGIGYYFLEAPKNVTSYAFHTCRVILVSSPNPDCAQPTDLNGGITGAYLRPKEVLTMDGLPYILYDTYGPLAYTPECIE